MLELYPFVKGRKAWALALSLAVGVLAGWVFSELLPRRNRVSVVVDAALPSGARLSLAVNGEASREIPVPTSERAEYAFSDLPGRIHRIAIGLPSVAGGELDIYNVRILRGEREVSRLTAADLSRFRQRDVRFRFLGDEGRRAVFAAGSSARLEQDFDARLAAGRAGPTWPTAQPAAMLILLIGSSGALVVLGRGRDRWGKDLAWGGLTVVVALVSAYAVARAAMGIPADPPTTAHAVGEAAYSGFAFGTTERAYLLALGAAIVVGLAAGRMRSTNGLLEEARAPSERRSLRVALAAAALVLLGVVVSLPNGYRFRNVEIELSQPNDYDVQNQTAWQFLLAQGQIPFRDFWYPYGGRYLSSLPWTPSTLWLAVHRLVVTLGVGACLWRALRGRIPWMVGAVSFSIWAVYADLFQAVDRYGLSVLLVVSFAAVVESRGRRSRLFWAAWGSLLAYVAVYEWVQILYALPGCAALLAAGFWLAPGNRRRLLTSASLALAVFVAGLAIPIAWMWRDGQLAGYGRFVRTLGDQVAYSTQAFDWLQWFRLPRDRDGLLLLVLFAAGALAAANVTIRRRELLLRHWLPVALVATGATAFQKQLMRPGIASQLLPIPLLGLFLLMFLVHDRERPHLRTTLATAAIGGFFLYAGYVDTGLARTALDSLRHAPANVAFALGLDASGTRALRREYFSPGRFQVGDESGEELRQWMAPRLEPHDAVFVLGDDPYVYIALDRTPPPYVSLYNQSPLSSQMEQISWLERTRPRFVLWRPNRALSDAVPEEVRIPLVFGYVVRHYVSDDQHAGFQLLRRRAPEEPVALDFYRRLAGDRLELGYLPALSAARESYQEKGAAAPGAGTPFLVVRSSCPEEGRTRELTFEVAGEAFRVAFRERAGVETYFIRADRLWFTEAAALPVSAENGLAVARAAIVLGEEVLY